MTSWRVEPNLYNSFFTFLQGSFIMWKKNLYPLAPYFILIAIRAIYNSSPKNWYRNWTHTIFPHSHVQITRQIVYKRKYGKTVLHYSTFEGNLYLSRQVFNSCGAIFEFFYFLFPISSTSSPILVRVLLSFRVDSVEYFKYIHNILMELHTNIESIETLKQGCAGGRSFSWDKCVFKKHRCCWMMLKSREPTNPGLHINM